jgi:hypothetical protein
MRRIKRREETPPDRLGFYDVLAVHRIAKRLGIGWAEKIDDPLDYIPSDYFGNFDAHAVKSWFARMGSGGEAQTHPRNSDCIFEYRCAVKDFSPSLERVAWEFDLSLLGENIIDSSFRYTNHQGRVWFEFVFFIQISEKKFRSVKATTFHYYKDIEMSVSDLEDGNVERQFAFDWIAHPTSRVTDYPTYLIENWERAVHMVKRPVEPVDVYETQFFNIPYAEMMQADAAMRICAAVNIVAELSLYEGNFKLKSNPRIRRIL